MEEVRISVRTHTEGETTELTVIGSVVQKEDTFYFRYVEQSPEGEIQNTVKFNGQKVIVIRSGARDMRLFFTAEKHTFGSMNIGAETIPLHAYTQQILYNETPMEKQLIFVYDLFISADLIGRFEITLTATSL